MKVPAREAAKIIAARKGDIPMCDCKIEWEDEYYIKYCPLHKAAPDLLTALRLCLPILIAHTSASHLTDGFRPRRNRNDDLLDRVKGAMGKGGGK